MVIYHARQEVIHCRRNKGIGQDQIQPQGQGADLVMWSIISMERLLDYCEIIEICGARFRRFCCFVGM